MSDELQIVKEIAALNHLGRAKIFILTVPPAPRITKTLLYPDAKGRLVRHGNHDGNPVR